MRSLFFTASHTFQHSGACVDMSDGLEEIFATCGVDANLSSAILMEGWNLTNFSVCASSLDKFDEVLPELCASFGDPTLIQKANLRAAFRMAQAKDPIPKDPGSSGGRIQSLVNESTTSDEVTAIRVSP